MVWSNCMCSYLRGRLKHILLFISTTFFGVRSFYDWFSLYAMQCLLYAFIIDELSIFKSFFAQIDLRSLWSLCAHQLVCIGGHYSGSGCGNRYCGIYSIQIFFRNSTKYRIFSNFTALPHTTRWRGHLHFCSILKPFEWPLKAFSKALTPLNEFWRPLRAFFNRAGCLHFFYSRAEVKPLELTMSIQMYLIDSSFWRKSKCLLLVLWKRNVFG